MKFLMRKKMSECGCKKVEISRLALSKEEITALSKFVDDYPENSIYILTVKKFGYGGRGEFSIQTLSGKDDVVRDITDWNTV